jgi:hypothetical protein
METKELIEDLRKQIAQVESEKHSTISIAGLKEYLVLVESDVDHSHHFLTRQHETHLAELASNTQWGTKLFDAVLESGKSALNALIIINGGAVIALMGVMSNLLGNPKGSELASLLSLPLLLFGLGVLCGGLGFAFRYFSQALYTGDFNESGKKYMLGGDIFRWLAILVALAGFLLFAFAIVGSYSAFSLAFKP